MKGLEREQAAATTAGGARSEVPSPRHVAPLLVQRPERVRAEEQAYLSRLYEQAPTIATVASLAREFLGMVRNRRGEQLDQWLRAYPARHES